MNWHSLADFIHMGGYGGYVWGAYIATFACIAIELVVLRLRGRSIRQEEDT